MTGTTEQCPWCGHIISRAKFEEIQAKIREDEQTKLQAAKTALRLELEEKHRQALAVERRAAEKRANDEAAKKIASKGGVVGLQFGNTFSNRAYYEWRQKGRPFGDLTGTLKRYGDFETIEALDKAVGKTYPSEPQIAPDEFRMGIDRLVEVIDYWIALVGEDHVSLGSDFDGGPSPPRGMRDIRDLAMITDAMLRRGYSEERIRKFLGGNLLRVFWQATEKKR